MTTTNLAKKVESYQRGYKDGATNKPDNSSIGVPAPAYLSEYHLGRAHGKQDYEKRMRICQARITGSHERKPNVKSNSVEKDPYGHVVPNGPRIL